MVTDQKRAANILREHFQSISGIGVQGGRDIVTIPKQMVGATVDQECLRFSELEVLREVKQLKNFTAMGGDKVKTEFLKHGGQQLVMALTIVCNGCVEDQWTPADWNRERVKALHKGGKDFEPKSFRGLAITSVVGKVFARLIAKRLTAFAEEHHLLPEQQAGFRKGRSVEDNIFILQAVIEDAKLHQQPLALCFVDIEKAYDHVNRDILWSRLQEEGVPMGLISLITLLYRATTRQVEWEGWPTEPFPSFKGLRQGCPLSPILFAIYIARVSVALDGRHQGVMVGRARITHLFFADDMVLISRTPAELQLSLEILTGTLHTLELKLNAAKQKSCGLAQVPLWKESGESLPLKGSCRLRRLQKLGS